MLAFISIVFIEYLIYRVSLKDLYTVLSSYYVITQKNAYGVLFSIMTNVSVISFNGYATVDFIGLMLWNVMYPIFFEKLINTYIYILFQTILQYMRNRYRILERENFKYFLVRMMKDSFSKSLSYIYYIPRFETISMRIFYFRWVCDWQNAFFISIYNNYYIIVMYLKLFDFRRITPTIAPYWQKNLFHTTATPLFYLSTIYIIFHRKIFLKGLGINGYTLVHTTTYIQIEFTKSRKFKYFLIRRLPRPLFATPLSGRIGHRLWRGAVMPQ